MSTPRIPTDLTRPILIGLAAGIVAGLIINGLLAKDGSIYLWLVDGLFEAVGRLFVNALRMLVVPLVLVSLICGASALGHPSKLGRVGVKTVSLYLATTAIAITLALAVASVVAPGEGTQLAGGSFEAAEPPSVKDVLVDIVPVNPVQAMAEGNMLQVIFFALLVGLALLYAGKSGERVRNFFVELDAVIMQIVNIVMLFAPIGVFALIARVFAQLGWESFAPLLDYFLVVLGVLLFHGLVVYSAILKGFTGLNPWRFIRKLRDAHLFAFSTASSNATIPVTLRTVEQKIGAKESVASFTIPLGATINMDGTAIMQGVATVFVANVYGIDLGIGQLLTVVLMAVLASIGTAGVPSVGLIMLTMVFAQIGLPVEGIALILGIDRLLDMTRTAVNITGDAVVTTIVARSEGEFSQAVFDDSEADETVDEQTQLARGSNA